MSIHDRFPFSWKVNDLRQRKIDETKKKNILTQDIAILDLGNRSHNALKRSAINTIQDVLDQWERIPRVRCFGEKCYGELKGKMIAYLVANEREDLIDQLLSCKLERSESA